MSDDPSRLADTSAALNPCYTLDTFVSGPFNQLAFTAAREVSRQSGIKYNPLYIFGPYGLGKTHLAQAIARAILAEKVGFRVRYCTAGQFVEELIQAIQHGTIHDFRVRYREGCDVLIIDGIEGLSGKDRSQVELFEAFNVLYNQHRQIVLTAGCVPEALDGFEARLTSRFGQGLVVDLQPPNAEERTAILRFKARAEGVELPDQVVEFIATAFPGSIRALEGALQRVKAQAASLNEPVTMALACGALAGLLQERAARLTVEAVQKAVAHHYNIKVMEMRSPSRYRRISVPRQIAMYLARKLCGRVSYPEIGRRFGGKDHSTVITACRKMEERLRENPTLRREVERLERVLQAGLEEVTARDGQAA